MSFNFPAHRDTERNLSCSWCNTGQYCYVKGSPFEDSDGLFIPLIPSEVQQVVDMIDGKVDILDWPERMEPTMFGPRKTPLKIEIVRETKELIFSSESSHSTGRYPIDYFIQATEAINLLRSEHFPGDNVIRPMGGMFEGSFVSEPSPTLS